MRGKPRTDFGLRLYEARKDAKLTQQQLAKAVGMAQSTLTEAETTASGSSFTPQLAAACGVRAEWLATGKEPKRDAAMAASNVDAAPTRRRVPVISWVQAGSWSDVQDNFHPGQADEWADAFDSLPGNNAFALRVVGDSMTNPIPGGRSFPEGTIIIVDPARGSGPGDYVIAKDVHSQQATFKQLTTDGGRWYLRPLNPAYPTIEIDDPDMRVIGRVIEYQTRGKL